MPGEQLARVFNEVSENDGESSGQPESLVNYPLGTMEAQKHILAYLIAFVHRRVGAVPWFEQTVENGVGMDALREGWVVDVDVEIETDGSERLSKVRRRFERYGVDGVDEGEVLVLWRAGHLTDEEAGAIIEKLEEHGEAADQESEDGTED
jgi:hypothetical protein